MVWKRNPPPLSLSLSLLQTFPLRPLRIYIYFLLVFVPFRFTGGRGRDKTIRLSRENSGPPLFSNVFDFDTKSINSLFVSRYRSPREGRKKTILMNFVEDVIVFVFIIGETRGYLDLDGSREENGVAVDYRGGVVADQCHDNLLPTPLLLRPRHLRPSSRECRKSLSPSLPLSFFHFRILLPFHIWPLRSLLLFSLSFFFSFLFLPRNKGILSLGTHTHIGRSRTETIEKSGCELLKLNHVRIHLYRSFFRGTSNVFGIEIETVRAQ